MCTASLLTDIEPAAFEIREQRFRLPMIKNHERLIVNATQGDKIFNINSADFTALYKTNIHIYFWIG